MPFTEVFGGSTLYPAQQSYLSLSMSTDQTLAWPIEQQVGGNVAADTIDVTALAAGLSIILPDARQVSTGYTMLFNNIGANTVSVKGAAGATIISLATATAWIIYLTDNTTLGGTWRIFQLGASVSTANASALAGAGLKAIASTLNQSKFVSLSSATPASIVDAYRAYVLIWTGGIGAWSLPTANVVGNDWFVSIRNSGSGNLTITPSVSLIDGAANLVLAPGESTTIVTDGSAYYTLSGGSSSTGSSFDFVTINVAGAGDYTLSGANLNRIAYKFTGILTGNRNIIVPNSIQEYWVDNETTGAFNLYVKTAAQVSPIQVLPSNRNILYCDGSDVINADSATVSFPIAVAQGGTGSNNSAAALVALGAAPVTRNLTAGAGLTGGGDLGSDRTFAVGAGTGIIVNSDDVALDTTNARNSNHSAISTIAGAGLVGGGTIDADRTLAVGAGTGIIVNSDDVAVDRVGTDGNQVGYLDTPANTQAGNYMLVIADRGKMIRCTSGSPQTINIPDNGSVAFPIGTVITIVRVGAGSVFVQTNADTLTLAGTSLGGSGGSSLRLIASMGIAVITKVDTTQWIISGAGVT